MNPIRPISALPSTPSRWLRRAACAAATAAALVLSLDHPVCAQGAAAATAAPTSAEQAQRRAQQRLWDHELAFERADRRLNAADADRAAALQILENARVAGISKTRRAKHELAIERASARHAWALSEAAQAKVGLDRARAEFEFADQLLRAERTARVDAIPAAPGESS